MKLPPDIQNQLLTQYHLTDFLLIELDHQGQVLDYQGNQKLLPELTINTPIQDHILALATETFDEDFFIPFYHLSDQRVIDLHHYCRHQRHHLVLLPQDQVFRETQLKQQVALETQLHNQNLESMLVVLQQTQAQLQQLNQDKSFLLSALSHEMGTPLNSILGHAQMGINDATSASQALTVILKNGHQLQNIINQTLNLDRDQRQGNKQSFQLLELLQELHDNLFPLASFKGLTFDINCAAHVTLYANRAQWQQVLTNLITNAIKYTHQGGLNVTVHTQAQGLLVDVTDSGIGISPEFQARLFNSWEREHKNQAKGSGIGLAIAKMLAEEMGLTLHLKHTSDQGSCFRVSHLTYRHQIKQVLIIEDDEDLRRLFVYYLQQLNLQVSEAGSWEAVHSRWCTQRFDAILTDRHLTDGQADDHLKQLKQMANQVLVMTGNPSQKQVNALIQHGFDQVLAKPLDQSQLEQALLK